MADQKITKFGFSQIGKQTPEFAHWIPQIYALLAVSGMGMMTALGIPATIQERISELCLAFGPLFILLGQMFGVQLPAKDGKAAEDPAPAPPPAPTPPPPPGATPDVGGSNPPTTGLPSTP